MTHDVWCSAEHMVLEPVLGAHALASAACAELLSWKTLQDRLSQTTTPCRGIAGLVEQARRKVDEAL